MHIPSHVCQAEMMPRRLHPAVTEAGLDVEGEEELSVQAAYTPESSCWGCGVHLAFFNACIMPGCR